MKNLLLLGMMLVWTLLFARVIAARATVGIRTVLVYIVVGAVLGPTLVMPLHRLVDPMGTTAGFWVELPRALLTIGVLALPPLVVLWRRGSYRLASISDAFLLAFAVGLGYEAAAAAFGAAHVLSGGGEPSLAAITALPPWNYRLPGGGVLGGSPYRVALVLLVFFGLLRFTRSRAAAGGAALVTLVLVALEAAAWANPAAYQPSELVRSATAGGTLLPWAAVALGAALAVLEATWVGAPKFAFVQEWRELGSAIADGGRRRAASAYRGFALARQLSIGERQLRDSADPVLQRAMATLREQLERPGDVSRITRESAAPPFLPPWVSTVMPWVALLVIVFLQPSPLYLLNAALASVIVWRIVAQPVGRHGVRTMDAVFQVAGERVLLLAALVASWAVLASAAPVHLFPWSPSQAQALGFALPRLISSVDPLAQETLNFVLMLLAVGGTQFAAVRADTWAEAWYPRRRSATVRRLIALATALVVATLALRAYVWGIPKIHARYGERMFATAAESFGRSTEFGNNFAVWAMTLVVAVGAGLFWILAIVVSRQARPRARRSARSSAA